MAVGRTIVIGRLLGWAFGPRNFMKIRGLAGEGACPTLPEPVAGGAGASSGLAKKLSPSRFNSGAAFWTRVSGPEASLDPCRQPGPALLRRWRTHLCRALVFRSDFRSFRPRGQAGAGVSCGGLVASQRWIWPAVSAKMPNIGCVITFDQPLTRTQRPPNSSFSRENTRSAVVRSR